MNKKEYLTEENYHRGTGILKRISLLFLILGLLLGGGLIAKGILNKIDVNSKHSVEYQNSISKKISKEKELLESKKAELEAKGVKYSSYVNYTDGEAYDLKIIINVLDPSFNHCKFEEYSNNSITQNYCSLKEQLEKASSDFDKDFDSMDSVPYFILGVFCLILFCMISLSLYLTSKRREILAFTTQQAMPIAQEGMEKMTPSVGKFAETIARSISKGIKDGRKDDETK